MKHSHRVTSVWQNCSYSVGHYPNILSIVMVTNQSVSLVFHSRELGLDLKLLDNLCLLASSPVSCDGLTFFIIRSRLCCVPGAVGYMGTSAFVRKIYTNVKID